MPTHGALVVETFSLGETLGLASHRPVVFAVVAGVEAPFLGGRFGDILFEIAAEHEMTAHVGALTVLHEVLQAHGRA